MSKLVPVHNGPPRTVREKLKSIFCDYAYTVTSPPKGHPMLLPAKVTDAQQLGALPPGVVLRDAKGAIWSRLDSCDRHGDWAMVGREDSWQAANIHLPATILQATQDGDPVVTPEILEDIRDWYRNALTIDPEQKGHETWAVGKLLARIEELENPQIVVVVNE